MSYSETICLWAIMAASLLSVTLYAAGIPKEGLVLHLDASRLSAEGLSADGKLPVWPDLSGKDNHVKQGDESRQPSLAQNALNGLAAVRFDGKGYLDGPAVLKEGAKCFTFVAVWRRNTFEGA